MDSNVNLEIKLPKVPNIEMVAIEGLERMGSRPGSGLPLQNNIQRTNHFR